MDGGIPMIRTPDSRLLFTKTDELIRNPYIGFTSFQHFRDEPLFSDCAATDGWKKEHYPVHSFVEQNGRTQGYYPDTEIAYIRCLWKDFEPTEGEYNFALIDGIFEKAEFCRQSVMLRLMPHTTRENEDVPDWLRAQIECPARPSSLRVKESPRDPLFLRKFSRAVKALGERYDSRTGFYAMDISLTGAWGEGSGWDTYPQKELELLIDSYTSAFPSTHLLGQICSPDLLRYANRARPVGLRGDGLGDGYHMNVYYPKNFYEARDIWKTAPISFEAFWYLNEWERKGWDIDEIIEQSLKWHISSFNGKSSAVPLAWKPKIDKWLKKMGYRYSLRLFEYPQSASSGDILNTVMWVENTGVAPLYSSLPFTFRLKNEAAETEFETETDVRRWMPGDTIERIALRIPDSLPKGKYSLACRLGGGKYPLVQFASDIPREDDGYYILTEICIE